MLSTVNAHLIAIDNLYRHLGLGPAVVKRQAVPKAALRAGVLADSVGGEHAGGRADR